MIGQEKLLDKFQKIYDMNLSLPRFTIITGKKGQGKKTLAREVAKRFNYLIIEVGNKIDDIRDAIELSYKQTEPIIYLLADADDMSLGAKNSLLKVIEEPPQQAYFMMTLTQIENTLETIKSRAYEVRMLDYSFEEKQQMIKELLPNATQEENQILNKLDNYYQIQKVISYGAKEFADYASKVFVNIHMVQSANSFKLAEKLDLKNDGNGYDLELFWYMFMNIGIGYLFDSCDSKTYDIADIIEKCLSITSNYINALSIKGINKQMLIDNWILAIRKVWLQNDKNRN